MEHHVDGLDQTGTSQGGDKVSKNQPFPVEFPSWQERLNVEERFKNEEVVL